MITKVYAIRDAKAETYAMPFYQPTPGVAERAFKELVNDPQSKVKNTPEDYSLWYLGEYDDNSGKLQPLAAPEHIISAVQLVNT